MSKIIPLKSLVSILLVSLVLILGSIKILSGFYPGRSKIAASDIELVSQEGVKTPYSTLSDKPKLVFFGFTHCPSICPAALANISATLDIIGDDAKKLHVIFVTTDPERDDPTTLKTYISNFNANIKGYTGRKDELKKIYKKYYVYTEDAPAGQTEYDLNHSTIIYLVGEDGELIDHYESDADPQEMAKAIEAHI